MPSGKREECLSLSSDYAQGRKEGINTRFIYMIFFLPRCAHHWKKDGSLSTHSSCSSCQKRTVYFSRVLRQCSLSCLPPTRIFTMCFSGVAMATCLRRQSTFHSLSLLLHFASHIFMGPARASEEGKRRETEKRDQKGKKKREVYGRYNRARGEEDRLSQFAEAAACCRCCCC